MKKIIATLMLISFLSADAGNEKLDWRTATESQLREVVSVMLSTNYLDGMKYMSERFSPNSIIAISRREDLDSFRLEADSALFEKGYSTVWGWSSVITWPKLSKGRRISAGVEKDFPKALSLALKYGCDLSSYNHIVNCGADIDEKIEAFSEFCSTTGSCITISFIDSWKKMIQTSAVKSIKRRLRMKGISFVTKDGSNPCEEWISKLTSALNAPKLEGMNKWLADLGYEGRVDYSKFPSDEYISNLKDSLFFGEKNMTAADKKILYVCLGVDGYNDFVKKYNGD